MGHNNISNSKCKRTLLLCHPDIALQWDDEKNGELTPEDVTVGSQKKVWWVCEKGHSWQAPVVKRTNRKDGCPYCSGRRVLAGFNDLATTFPDIALQWDSEKNEGVTPEDVTSQSNKNVWWICLDASHSWKAIVSNRTKNKTGCPYCSGRKAIKGSNDLASTYPHIASQWDHKKNGELTPEDVTAGSQKKVWWLCEKGHSYQSIVGNRTKGLQGCPYCSGRKVLAGFNDLATMQPDIAAQWDYKKNATSPNQVSPGSNKHVWWVCGEGHSWKSRIADRKRFGCPYCAGRKALAGFNDLATVFPSIAKQWDSEKNTLLPHQVLPGSNKHVWWVCDMGHNWKATVISRTNGSGCPYCSGKSVLSGFNDLATVSPSIAAQWDSEKNGDFPPSQVTSGSGAKVWWICENGHSWKAVVADRKRFGCPHCCNKVSKQETELAEYVGSMLSDETTMVTSNRSLLGGLELDIYIPDLDIAIEYNGLYWHAESQGKDKNYHYNKWKMCADQGIQLITIWEDEWRDKQEVVKSMLAHKLGVSNEKRVYARNTFVSLLDHTVAQKFLDMHHIQGAVSSSAYIGLHDDCGNVVAVSAWKKNRDIIYLDRYATSATVIGGMGKLLKAGRQYAMDHGCVSIVTFSDNCVSNGKLYEQLGFVKDKELPPDYKYMVAGERRHKFGYRLKRFKNDAELVYVEGMTEYELAKLNSLHRIWDCGKTRWVMKV